MNNNNNNNVSKKRKIRHPRRQWTTDEYEKLWDGCSSSGNRWKQISVLQFNSNISASLIQNHWNSIPFRKWASSNKNAEPKAFLKAQTEAVTKKIRVACLDCHYIACQCAVTTAAATQTKAETKKIREACLDCRYIACQCAVTTQTIAETKKIWEAATAAATQKKATAAATQKKAETKKIREAATAAATQKKAETKKIREAATAAATQKKAETKKIREAATAAATQKKAETKKIREAATAAATQKKAETKKIREVATDNRVSALKAKKMKEAADQEKWVDELGNPTPIYKYSIEEVRLINMKFSPNNPDEKKQYNSTKVFTRNFPIDLSLKKEQELALAWVGDENTIFKLQQDQQDQQEQPDSPQYINIPDNLHPAINLRETLRTGVKLLKLKSVNDKELMVLFCQAIDLLFTVRITHKSFWNGMLPDCGNLSRQQAEGFYTWKGRFNNKFFCTIFLKILKSLHLTEKDIDDLLKVLPPAMRSIAHLCQLSYNYMGLLDLWICERNDPHCAFGVIGNKGSILYTDYDTFQKKRSAAIQGITIDANDTRELFQGAVNQVLSGGNFITTGWEESKPISFGPMLVTVSASETGAIRLRDVIVDKDNCTAVVSEKCTLKEKLKEELSRLEYSGDANQHVRQFIYGLFGKSDLMLFGRGNAWKIEFDSEDNIPSTLNLKHYGHEFVPVSVTGQGKTIKKE